MGWAPPGRGERLSPAPSAFYDVWMGAERKPTNWRAWIFGALIALVVIVSLQNSQTVEVEVLFVNVDAPLIVTLLAAVAIGALIGYVAPLVRRHRREERQEKGR